MASHHVLLCSIGLNKDGKEGSIDAIHNSEEEQSVDNAAKTQCIHMIFIIALPYYYLSKIYNFFF